MKKKMMMMMMFKFCIRLFASLFLCLSKNIFVKILKLSFLWLLFVVVVVV